MIKFLMDLAKKPYSILLERKELRIIQSSFFFDSSYYLHNYPDVAQSGINPALHYYFHGWKEGRDPSQHFSTTFYLLQYPDVCISGLNPLIHYETFGKKESRLIAPSEVINKVRT